MFQLIDLIMTSPIGVFALNVIQDVIYAAIVVSDCDECGFNDLGKLLFGGLVLAILAGIGVSVLHRRIKEKHATESHFVSIREPNRKS